MGHARALLALEDARRQEEIARSIEKEGLSVRQTEALIRKALARSEGNVSQAADALGLSRSALYRRLEKHGL